MSARRRLISGFSATAIGPFITALVQIVSVPLFLRVWGAHLYGEWLVISAIPAYLSLSDMGFGTVAGNDMTMCVANGDRRSASQLFQSTFFLVVLMSIVIGAIALGPIFFGPITNWLHVTSLSLYQTRVVLIILSIYTLVTLQGSVLMSGFRSDGQYALGATGIAMMRLTESAAMLLLVAQNKGPIEVAAAAAASRIVGTLLLYWLLLRKLPWLRQGPHRPSWNRVKALIRPAFAFMAFPAGNALSLQGMTVVVGTTLGPVAVATFGPMRTLSRFVFQVIDSIKNATWPELSAAYGSKNWPLARKLHRSSCLVAFWFSIAAVVGLAVTGPAIFRIWTHNRVIMDVTCFRVLLAVVVASSVWNTSSAVPIAANLHERLAAQYLFGTFTSLILAIAIIPYFQITGAALALLGADLWMGFFVLRASNDLLKDDTNDFLRSIFSFNRLRLLLVR
jgi:O-antigen/teichoic acid export membrane protein